MSQASLSRAIQRCGRLSRAALRGLREWFGRPDRPEDPYSYVTAPKKPRPPHRSAAAVADWPEK